MDQSKIIDASIEALVKNCDNINNNKLKEKLIKSVSKIKSFFLIILKHLIIITILVLSIATIISIVHNSVKLFFVVLVFGIPIIIGVGLFSIGKALSNFILGINDISDYLLELVSMYYKEKIEENERAPSISIAIKIIFTNVMLPALNVIITQSLIGKLVIKTISKSVHKLSAKIHKDTEFTTTETIQTPAPTMSENTYDNEVNLLRVENIRNLSTEKSNNYIKRLRLIINILSVLCVLVGIPIAMLIVILINLLGKFFIG